jgi:hypothetical protein
MAQIPVAEGVFTFPAEEPQLIGSKCADCGMVTFPTQASCPRCGSIGMAEHLLARTGTLWEGRYRSTLIQTDRYLLACMAYIDLNPVRAHMVAQPENYVWSSYAHYAGHRIDRLITPHALVWGLGNTPFAREAAYAELVHAGISADQQSALTDATLSGWALGDERFVADLQSQTERRIVKTKAGRPFSKTKPAEKLEK